MRLAGVSAIKNSLIRELGISGRTRDYVGRQETLLSAGMTLGLGTGHRTGGGEGCPEQAHIQEPKGDVCH